MPKKDKKKHAKSNNLDEEEDGKLSQASSNMEEDEHVDTDSELSHDVHLGVILKELRDFRRDST